MAPNQRGPQGPPATDSRALPGGSTVWRATLLARLADRFDVRLTTVVAGAGAGKTTTLAQALRTEGETVDVWHPCTTAHRDASRLLTSLAIACADALDEYPPAPETDQLDAIAEMIVASSPGQVCLVLDDAHILDGDHPLDQLLRALPTNGHLLLSGRRLPDVSTARLATAGDVIELRQRDLLLSDDELAEFARQRGLDVDLLAGAERWPAFVELAARGGVSSPRDYLREEVVPGLGADRRAALAAFAFVNGGDEAVASAVTGLGLDELLSGVPLVRWTGPVAQLHDLWIELLADELDDHRREDVVRRAATLHRERGDFDRAIELYHQLDRWDLTVSEVGEAIRQGVDGGLTEQQLRRWLAPLPAALDDNPTVLLARGVIERERDPTSERTTDLLDRAAHGFSDVGDDAMELVALLQLGYVTRLAVDPSLIEPVTARLDALADRFAPARPFRSFGAAWTALVNFDNEGQLAAMREIEHVQLPPTWAASRDHLLANALFQLGRADEALQRAPDVEALRIPVPGALATRSQSLWFAGRPIDALTAPMGYGPRHGARDRMIATAWTALMRAWAGDLGGSRDARALAEQHAGELPALVTQIQLAGLDLIAQLANGNEADAAATLQFFLDAMPLGSGPLEGTLQAHIALPYVLAPDTRDRWDNKRTGPTIARRRDIAAAFVSARSGDASMLAPMDWADPAFIAVTLPVHWAIEFGLLAIEGGERTGGRRLLAWLCEHWGQPARSKLRGWSDDDRLGAHARDVLIHTPMPPKERVTVDVLGDMRLAIDGYPSDDPNWRRERVRALLVWLIIHRQGTRDQVAGTLWPDVAPNRASQNLRTTLNYLHKLLEPSRRSGNATWFVRVNGPSIWLNPTLDVDAWRFATMLDDAEQSESVGRVTNALPLLLDAIDAYRGDLAPDLDSPWVELDRIHLSSRFVRAACRSAELLVATGQPDRAIAVARRALTVDAFHASSYSALATAYEAVGDLSSARAVRDRAATHLAGLIDSADLSTD